MLDLHRIKLLRALKERKTITSVAATLGFTASAVSQQLATLEKEVGTKLLEPDGRRVKLTDQGEILARHATVILAAVEAAEAELQSSRKEVVGTFRLAGFQSSAMALVPDAIKFLRDQHPRLRLEFSNIEAIGALEAVRSSEIDIAVVEDLPGGAISRSPGVEFTRIVEDELFLVLGPLEKNEGDESSDAEFVLGPDSERRPKHLVNSGKVLDLRFLATARWVMEPPNTLARRSTEAICSELGFTPDGAFESTDVMMHMRLIATGQAIGVIPALALAHSQVPLRVQSFPGMRRTRVIYTVTRSGAVEHPAVVSTIAALRRAAVGLGLAT